MAVRRRSKGGALVEVARIKLARDAVRRALGLLGEGRGQAARGVLLPQPRPGGEVRGCQAAQGHVFLNTSPRKLLLPSSTVLQKSTMRARCASQRSFNALSKTGPSSGSWRASA